MDCPIVPLDKPLYDQRVNRRFLLRLGICDVLTNARRTCRTCMAHTIVFTLPRNPLLKNVLGLFASCLKDVCHQRNQQTLAEFAYILPAPLSFCKAFIFFVLRFKFFLMWCRFSGILILKIPTIFQLIRQVFCKMISFCGKLSSLVFKTGTLFFKVIILLFCRAFLKIKLPFRFFVLLFFLK